MFPTWKYAQNIWWCSAQCVASYGRCRRREERKTPQDWPSEHEEFEAKMKCISDGKEAKMLIRKYCSIG